jgi:glycogen operon protein
MGRTQRGNNNAYCQDNDVSWVAWDEAAQWSDLTDLVRRLLRIRSEHPVFRQRHFFAGRPAVPGGRKDIAWFAEGGAELTEEQWWDPGRRTLGLFLAGDAIRSRHSDGSRIDDDSFLLWLHAADTPCEVTLPDHDVWASRYTVLVDTADLHRESRVYGASTVMPLNARSAVLLRADR